MKLEELKSKSANELRILLDNLKNKLRGLKFDLSAGRVKNIRQINETKRTIARILTILNNRK